MKILSLYEKIKHRKETKGIRQEIFKVFYNSFSLTNLIKSEAWNRKLFITPRIALNRRV